MARTGRRPGASGTREAILAAARAEFAARGYDGASVRGVARAAAVDPALVHHYFGSKRGLFAAAMRLPADPAAVVAAALDGPRDGIGDRLIRAMLAVWDGPGREQLLSVLRSAIATEEGAAIVQQFFAREVVARVAEELGTDDAEKRATLAASQVVGLAVARYVLRFEPLASLPADEVARAVGPTLQRYLDGELIT